MWLSPLHLRAGSFLHHFITPCGLLLFRSIGLPMGNSFTYLGRFSALCWARHSASAGKTGERCSSSACSGQLPPSVWSSPIRHSQRSGIHHSFHVSAGRGTGHDGLFRRKESFAILFAVLVSLSGAGLLSSGKIDFEGGNTTSG